MAVGLLKTVAYVLGSVLLFVASAMAISALVSVVYAENEEALLIAAAAGVTAGLGLVTRRLVRRPKAITVRQGFATVGMAWFVISIFGSLPYLLTVAFTPADFLGDGAFTMISNAIFETASGFTTTGASVLSDPSVLPRGLSFWRAMTQWLGGMGVIARQKELSLIHI